MFNRLTPMTPVLSGVVMHILRFINKQKAFHSHHFNKLYTSVSLFLLICLYFPRFVVLVKEGNNGDPLRPKLLQNKDAPVRNVPES